MTFNATRLLLLIAILCFVLAAFGVNPDSLNLTDVGLAFFASSFLV